MFKVKLQPHLRPENIAFTRWIQGYVGFRADLEHLAENKISSLYLQSNPGFSSVVSLPTSLLQISFNTLHEKSSIKAAHFQETLHQT
jgi:hypothetical protein